MMDSGGVSAAAYAISLQFWQLSGVSLFALQSSASILVPAALARAKDGGPDAARRVADRLLMLGLTLGVLIGCVQLASLPLLSAFSTLPEVTAAATAPVCIASFMTSIAGVVFAGEGIMMGRGAWGHLARLTAMASTVMITLLEISRRLDLGLIGVWSAISAFNLVNLGGVLYHHLVITPRKEAREAEDAAEKLKAASAAEA